MDNKSKETNSTPILTENGFFIRGVVISNSARKITSKKDGAISALVTHELALQPGIAKLERFIDPRNNLEVQIEGDEVKKYPQLKEFDQITVKASRIRENNGQISVINWEII